ACFFRACEAMFWPQRAPGKRPAIGGERRRGSRRNGIWSLPCTPRGTEENYRTAKLSATAGGFASIATRNRKPGLCDVYTTDVHGASCSLGIQLSRRRLGARRAGERVR